MHRAGHFAVCSHLPISSWGFQSQSKSYENAHTSLLIIHGNSMPLHTLFLQPLSPSPSEVCSDVFVCSEYRKSKRKIHAVQTRIFANRALLWQFLAVLPGFGFWKKLSCSIPLCPFNLFIRHFACWSTVLPSINIFFIFTLCNSPIQLFSYLEMYHDGLIYI